MDTVSSTQCPLKMCHQRMGYSQALHMIFEGGTSSCAVRRALTVGREPAMRLMCGCISDVVRESFGNHDELGRELRTL
jgi:hypothetical protein